MMYLIDFEGEAVIAADDEEQARDYLAEDFNEAFRMGSIKINKVKELD